MKKDGKSIPTPKNDLAREVRYAGTYKGLPWAAEIVGGNAHHFKAFRQEVRRDTELGILHDAGIRIMNEQAHLKEAIKNAQTDRWMDDVHYAAEQAMRGAIEQHRAIGIDGHIDPHKY